MEFSKYDPLVIEAKWYALWEEKGYFQPSMALEKKSFSILLPPPNVTGVLHMGHAFNQTIMDALIRYHRMRGENVCWVPGFDHAGIATQMVVERQLESEGTTRHELGKKVFLDRTLAWKNVSGKVMKEQMKRLGCSLDWTREYFTMDDIQAKTVTEVFVRLYEDGLIYRSKRLVNWDPVLETAISDLEVEHTEESGSMWYIQYHLKDRPAESLIIATTRPETLLGDVAVAVHPEDLRYQSFVGKEVIVPLVNRAIPIIADEQVAKDFGTGCVKITPAHDFNDYVVGQRHDTILINIFDSQGKVMKSAQVYTYKNNTEIDTIALPNTLQGLDRFAAREIIVQELTDHHQLVDIKPHIALIPRGDRTGSVIEPMLTQQWFVSMDKAPEHSVSTLSLGDQARRILHDETISFVPKNWINTYRQWVNHLQDWCISRQLWWGHQIPAWYDKQGNIFVARNKEAAIEQADTEDLIRDTDVLDTWFSSALVPFSTLGWPNHTDEITAFLPSSILITGYEIIFFWVARMIMMTAHFTGSIPFQKVYIHGVVKDHEGKKMSKSEGNVLDPVDIIDGVDLDTLLKKRTTGLRQPEKAEKIAQETRKLFPVGIEAYGADALRYTMASYASLGRSINFDWQRCEGYRNFCNKIWHAARFVLMHVNLQEDEYTILVKEYSWADKWILDRLETLKLSVTEAFNTYRLDIATQLLYEFIWNEYCDWYIELAKVQLRDENPYMQITTRHVLLEVLEVILRLLHPIMPFITEEIWQTVAVFAHVKKSDSIMISNWPMTNKDNINSYSLEKINLFKGLVGKIRHLKTQMGLKIGSAPPLLIEGSKHEFREFIQYLPIIARLGSVEFVSQLPKYSEVPVITVGKVKCLLKVAVNQELECVRLNKELEKLNKELAKIENKFNQPGYQTKAPKHLVEKDKVDLNSLLIKIHDIQTKLSQLKK